MTHSRNSNKSSYASPWRVTYLDHCARMSGGERALLHLVQELNRSVVDPSVLIGEEGPLESALHCAGVHSSCVHFSSKMNGIHRYEVLKQGCGNPQSLFHLLNAALKVSQQVRLRQAILLHCNSLKADIVGGFAGKLAHVGVVWHVRDSIHSGYIPVRLCKFLRLLCHYIPDGIIANSHATLRSLLPDESDIIPSSHSLMRVIHDGVPLSAFVQGQAHDKLKGLTVGMIGRIAPWKGQHIFVSAAKRLHTLFPDVRFVIVGAALFEESEYESEIKRMVGEEASEYITLTGFHPKPEVIIPTFDILVHASTIGEPFGQVVIEGMAAGVPVIATNGGGIPEIIEDGVNGLLAEMGDSQSLTDGIHCLLKDEELRNRLSVAGRQRVLESFTMRHTAVKVEEYYNDLLAK